MQKYGGKNKLAPHFISWHLFSDAEKSFVVKRYLPSLFDGLDCVFLYSLGVSPVAFLKVRLNADLELKPDSTAMPNKEKL